MVSSIIWWSITMFVVIVIRPLNKTGSLSIILPKIRKLVIYSSTISITTGTILFIINSNFQFLSPFYSMRGWLIFSVGMLSLIVYLHVLFQLQQFSISRFVTKNIFKNTLSPPHILFSILTISLIIMLFVSRFY